MFKPREFVDGPRAGDSVPHGELPGQTEFDNGYYRLVVERLSNEDYLSGNGPAKEWYQWHGQSE